MRVGAGGTMAEGGEASGSSCGGALASLELWLWGAEDALRLLHLGAAVAGVVHFQAVI